MAKNIDFNPQLDIWLLHQFEVGNVLVDKDAMICICWYHQRLEVGEVARDLEHQVHAPDFVHAGRHKNHEAERND